MRHSSLGYPVCHHSIPVIRRLKCDWPLFAGLFYINAYGNEIHPSPNPDYISSLGSNDILVYSCGSLWTRLIRICALNISMC